MARIIFKDVESLVPDGSEMKDVCEPLGVEFGCRNGFCRTCEVTIVDGYDNLTALSENEEFIELPKPRRLLCQCKVISGTVKIDVDSKY